MHQDITVFDDMIAKLEQTNLFGLVRWGDYEGTIPAAGASLLIHRTGFLFDEQSSSSDADERVVQFTGTLRYINNDYNLRRKYILKLEANIYNTIHHKRLGGITIPMKTIIRRAVDGSQLKNVPAGMSLIRYDGAFVYRIAQTDGLNTD